MVVASEGSGASVCLVLGLQALLQRELSCADATVRGGVCPVCFAGSLSSVDVSQRVLVR